jgi:ATP-binding cassette subfamily G (WHITE) protein 2 (SNQ2)
LILTEFNTGRAGEGSTILFKRGSKALVLTEATASVGSDEEKGETPSPFPTVGTEDSNKKNQVLQGQPKLTKTFSWKQLNCAVSVSGERRLLLDDISGFVAPGKLTALMGESGAGKVWGFFNVCRVPRF